MQAPVAIFVYSRADLLKKTLQALKSSIGFKGRQVVIFCDGPIGADANESGAVRKASAVAESWGRKNHVRVICSADNRGLRQSIEQGVTAMVNEYGRVIVLEDDIIVSKSFLLYMDASLEKFAQHEAIWQVSGYFTPPRRRRLPCGLLRVPGCWGWGTWKRAWKNYCSDVPGLIRQIAASERQRFNLDGTYDYYGALQANAAGTLNIWHVRWYASMFLHGAFALYPGISQTRNIGFDTRGTNCRAQRTSRRFVRQRISRIVPNLDGVNPPFVESRELLEEMTSFFRWQGEKWSMPTLRERIVAKLRRVLQ